MFFFSQISEEPLIKTCREVLIQKHLSLFQVEFEQLLLNESDEDLGRMFKICEHVDGAFEMLRSILEKHIEAKGRMAIERVANKAMTVSGGGVSKSDLQSSRLSAFSGSKIVHRRDSRGSQSLQQSRPKDVQRRRRLCAGDGQGVLLVCQPKSRHRTFKEAIKVARIARALLRFAAAKIVAKFG